MDNLDLVTPVSNNLFITNMKSANDIGTLQKHQIQAVIMLEKTPKPESVVFYMKNNNIDYLVIPIDDHPSENIKPFLVLGSDFITKHENEQRNVLCHCFAGVSRSASVVIYHLARKLVQQGVNHLTAFNQAMKFVSNKRPVNPNEGFVVQIIECLEEDALKNKNKNNSLTNLNTSNNNTKMADTTSCDIFKTPDGKPGNIICLSEADFDNNGTLTQYSDLDGVILFFADWCGHCKHVKPDFALLSNSLVGSDIRAFIVNADKNKNLLAKINANPQVWGFSARGFPTIVGYSKGKFFAEYEDDDRNSFRKAASLLEFAKGLGKANVEWKN